MKIIYVCQNNKGRSPALKVFTDFFLDVLDIKDISVLSAGINKWAIQRLRREQNDGISRTTKYILSTDYKLGKFQSAIDNHRLRHITELPEADLVLATDKESLEELLRNEEIQRKFPSYRTKSMLAGDFARSRRYKEIFGPHSSTRGNVTHSLGYQLMIEEIHYISQKIANRLAETIAKSH